MVTTMDQTTTEVLLRTTRATAQLLAEYTKTMRQRYSHLQLGFLRGSA